MSEGGHALPSTFCAADARGTVSEWSLRSAEQPLGALHDRERFAPIQTAIHSRLTWRERLVLQRLYGLQKAPETLKDIAEYMGVSRERVRQLSKNALQKLRFFLRHDAPNIDEAIERAQRHPPAASPPTRSRRSRPSGLLRQNGYRVAILRPADPTKSLRESGRIAEEVRAGKIGFDEAVRQLKAILDMQESFTLIGLRTLSGHVLNPRTETITGEREEPGDSFVEWEPLSRAMSFVAQLRALGVAEPDIRTSLGASELLLLKLDAREMM